MCDAPNDGVGGAGVNVLASLDGLDEGLAHMIGALRDIAAKHKYELTSPDDFVEPA